MTKNLPWGALYNPGCSYSCNAQWRVLPQCVARVPPLKTTPPGSAKVIRVSNNIAYLGSPKAGPRPPQLLQLPPFPAAFTASKPLPGRKRPPSAPPGKSPRITAVTWLKYYFADVIPSVIQAHFNKGQVLMECPINDVSERMRHHVPIVKKVKVDDVMTAGTRLYIPVSVVDSKISTRYDTIPTATSNPNADEIHYIRRLVVYKDSTTIMLNKPPKLPVKGNFPVQESMDALAKAALSYGNQDGPKLVHRLDRESSGLVVLARTQESFSKLHALFSGINTANSSQIWNEACNSTIQKYWALVIGSPKKKEGFISAPLSTVLLNGSKTERVIMAHRSSLDGCQEAVTEYRVMGPTICGCSWLELHPLTGLRHQLRVHCAEALGTPIVGDYNYGWYAHQRWLHSSRVDYNPRSGVPYRLRRPEGLQVQKGSVLSKVPLLHLHCREMVIPNIEKFFDGSSEKQEPHSTSKPDEKPDLLHFVAPMPTHMKISWSVMSNYLE